MASEETYLAPRSSAKYGQRDRNRVARQARHFLDERIIREPDQILRVITPFTSLDLLAGDLHPLPVEVGCAGDDDEISCIGLKPLGKVQRLRNVPPADDAGYLVWSTQGGKGFGWQATNNDRHIRSNCLAMLQNERRCFPACRYYDVGSPAGIFFRQIACVRGW